MSDTDEELHSSHSSPPPPNTETVLTEPADGGIVENTRTEETKRSHSAAESSNSSDNKSQSDDDEDEDELDDEDLELIAENTGMKVVPKKSAEKNFRRIKRRRQQVASSSGEEDDEKHLDAYSSSPETKRHVALENIFDNDEDGYGTVPKETALAAGMEGSEEDEDDEYDEGLDDFIVDDDEPSVGPAHRKSHDKSTEVVSGESSSSVPRTKSRPVFSLSGGESYQEMLDIFGDGSEYPISAAAVNADDVEEEEVDVIGVPLDQAFEPSVLEAAHYTPYDSVIRAVDLPERFQERDGSERGLLSQRSDGSAGSNKMQDELFQETVWIANQLIKYNSATSNETDESKKKEFLKATSAVCKFLREDAVEVPFILNHRKEFWMGILRVEDIWTIYDLDEAWKLLQEKKRKLGSLLSALRNRVQQVYGDGLSLHETLQYISDLLQESQEGSPSSISGLVLEEEDLEDISEYILYQSELNGMDVSSPNFDPSGTFVAENPDPSHKYKRPVSTKKKDISATFGNEHNLVLLKAFGSGFGITAKQYGINLLDNEKRYNSVSTYPIESPDELAAKVAPPGLSAASTKSAAIDILAKDLLMDPIIRRSLRGALEELITIKTSPSKPLGRINPNDPNTCLLASVSYLTDKPILSVSAEQWTAIRQGLETGMLELSVSLNKLSDALSLELEALLLTERHVANQDFMDDWDRFRKDVLHRTFQADFCVPFWLKKRVLKLFVVGKSNSYLKRYLSGALFERAFIGPYYTRIITGGKEKSSIPDAIYSVVKRGSILAMACIEDLAVFNNTSIPSSNGVIVAVLSCEGQLLDLVTYYHLLGRSNAGPDGSQGATTDLVESDQRELLALMRRVQPYHISLSPRSRLLCSVVQSFLETYKRSLEKKSEGGWLTINLPESSDAPRSSHSASSDNFSKYFTWEIIARPVDDSIPLILSEVSDFDSRLLVVSGTLPLISSITAANMPVVRYVASLGRMAIDPLLETSLLAKSGRLSQVSLHPYQRLIGELVLQKTLERVLVNLVSVTGVDLHRAVKFFWASSALPFVCGLGPRKASALLKKLSSSQSVTIYRRQELLSGKLLSPRVYFNAASFLIISDDYATQDCLTSRKKRSVLEQLDVLDCTRIHPENYFLARKMACDALDIPDDGNENEDGEAPGLASSLYYVEQVMKDPGSKEKLQTLLLDAFSKELQTKKKLMKHHTLVDARQELLAPYKDHRIASSSELDYTAFMYWHLKSISGGLINPLTAPYLLAPGTRLSGKVVSIRERNVSVRLISPFYLVGWQMSIYITHLCDSYIDSTRAVVRAVGENLDAKLLRLSPEKMMSQFPIIDGTRKSNEFLRAEYPPVDPIYDDDNRRQQDIAGLATCQQEAQLRRLTLTFDRGYDNPPFGNVDSIRNHSEPVLDLPPSRCRLLNHPHFFNVSRAGAERCLGLPDTRLQFLFRPSSKGHSHIALSWKPPCSIDSSSMVHWEIAESNKDDRNSHALGKHLSILVSKSAKPNAKDDIETFDDLDEIIARFLEPRITQIRSLVAHPKYNPSLITDFENPAATESFLFNSWRSDPRHAHYVLSTAKGMPDRFILSHLKISMPSGKRSFIHDWITPTSFGLRFRGQHHDTAIALVNSFKLLSMRERDSSDHGGPPIGTISNQKYSSTTTGSASHPSNVPSMSGMANIIRTR